jgi:hypothetical protein
LSPDGSPARHSRWEKHLFALLVGTYLAGFLLFYPATWAIDDEGSVLALTASLSRGTVFLDRAGIDVGTSFAWNGHLLSKFSPFHALLFVPFIDTNWRLMFLVGPAFVVTGAFVIRRMLQERGLPEHWIALYFLCPGLIYYSRTLMAAVPAAVLALIGTWLLFRARPRPAIGALALAFATLLHVWMGPVAVALAVGWWFERGRRVPFAAAKICAGALPGVLALAGYNWLTTGTPFQNVYSLIGVHRMFAFAHLRANAAFYAVALALSPPFGWAVARRKYAGSTTIALAAVTTVILASLYYFRDARAYSVVGFVPGQRFLIPVSLLAVVPAAAAVDELCNRGAIWRRLGQKLPTVLAGAAVLGMLSLHILHQEYLKANASIQDVIRSEIPSGSEVLASDRALKHFAPVIGAWRVVPERAPRPGKGLAASPYRAWVVPHGTSGDWFRATGDAWIMHEVHSWIQDTDVWIGRRLAGQESSEGR